MLLMIYFLLISWGKKVSTKKQLSDNNSLLLEKSSDIKEENVKDVVVEVTTTTTIIANNDSKEPSTENKIQNSNLDSRYVEIKQRDPEVNDIGKGEGISTSNKYLEIPSFVTPNTSKKLKEKKIIYEVEPTDSKISQCYILTTKLDINSALEIFKSHNIKAKDVYKEHINGISFCIDDPSIIEKLKQESGVTSLEEDVVYKISSVQYPISKHLFLMNNYVNSVFNNHFYDNMVFSLLQINNIFRYLIGSYTYFYTGKNTRIFLLDTTVSVNNPNITNRSGKKRSCNNHGNVSVSLIIDKMKGFARDSEVFVLDGVDCSGNIKLSTILKELEYVKKDEKGTVLLFGITGPYSMLLNEMVDRISKKGIIVVSPSGSQHDNACYYSPGSAKSSITVGSVNKFANVSNFSNYGNCVRLYSLGENVNELSNVRGTSFSAATIAGAISIFLEKYSNAEFEDVWGFINKNSFWTNNSFLIMKLPYLSEEYDTQLQESKTEYLYSDYVYFYLISFVLLILLVGLVIFIIKRFRKADKRDTEYIIHPNQRD